jgi:cardiolipin synthase
MLQYLPNTLTACRLLLALPLGILILQKDYELALWVGFFAGMTDALDGFFARHLNAFSRLGAALDPIADKVLITVSVLTFAQVQLIPWYVALTVVARDLVIVSGAIGYHFLIGPFDFSATRLSKVNMSIQIGFCFLVLCAQVFSGFPADVIPWASGLLLAITLISGLDYVLSWSRRAVQNRRGPQS